MGRVYSRLKPTFTRYRCMISPAESTLRSPIHRATSILPVCVIHQHVKVGVWVGATTWLTYAGAFTLSVGWDLRATLHVVALRAGCCSISADIDSSWNTDKQLPFQINNFFSFLCSGQGTNHDCYLYICINKWDNTRFLLVTPSIFIENIDRTGNIRECSWTTSFLILLLIVGSSSSALALLGVLSLDTAWASATVRRPQGEVNVLLAVQTNHKGGDVHHLLADTAKTKREVV